jgi:anhydro-N-acetylmuramic acid kinase
MPRVIGLMSGTSLDGVDAAWLDTDGERIAAFGPSLTLPYDAELRRDLRALLDAAPVLSPNDAGLLDAIQRLTAYHARAVKALNAPADIIGFHGQTILHQPARGRTWQIGDAAGLAEATGLPVVFDFRSADISAGGQGAPLVPVYHSALAANLPKPLAVLNIGGVANVTWIGPDGGLVAFDTGPGNGALDDWTTRHTGQPFDTDGALARSGSPDAGVLARLLADPYFSVQAPKSLDRLDFAKTLAASGLAGLSAPDGASTLAEFTIRSVAAASFPQPPRRWLVCGGGRHNSVLMEGLRRTLGVPVEPVEMVGWDGDVLEAQCFAFLAARTLRGLPITFPSTTGVPVSIAGGQIAYVR